MAAHMALLASGLMFRFVLPLVLMAATACRYNFFSLCYLVGLLALPLCPEPGKDSMRGRTGLLLKALSSCSLFFLLSHLVFHCTMLALKPSPSFNCSWALVTWHIGLERVHDADWLNTLRIFLPDLAVFSACLGLIVLVCRFLKKRRNHPSFLLFPPPSSCSPQCAGDLHSDMNKNGRPQGDGQVRLAQAEDSELDADDQELLEEDEKEGETLGREVRWKRASGPWKSVLGKMATVLVRVKAAVGDILNRGGQVVAAACLGVAGVYVPSLISTLYFATYLVLGGWWACAQNFHRPALRFLNITFAIYSASHLLCLYLYQMWFFQSVLPPDHVAARLLGLVAIFRPDYTKPWQLILNCHSLWPHLVGLVILLLLYFTLATLIRFSLVQRDTLKNGAILRRDLSEEELMLEEFSAAARLRVIHAVTVDEIEGEGPSSMTSEKPAEMNVKENLQLGIKRLLPGRFDRLTAHMSTAARFVMQQSYICALVTMMAWSITEPSWLTFVFLVWACLIWMLRDRRYHGMRSAPYLVVYASLLCTLHYIWNFNLDEKELPPIHGVISNCERGVRSTGSAGQSITPSTEIGGRESCPNRCIFVMGILVLYTLVFWVLLRQHVSECRVAKRSQMLKDSGLDPENTDSEQQDSEVVQLIGNVLMSILSKYWIYVCGGMIFIVSFEGRLVVYKIIYMIIFLLCACVYQIFFEWWRHNLRSFWLVVISYTMVVLVSVYTFQFDGIDEIWTNIAHLTTTQLQDLGLERFSVGDLFSRIFIPTAFLLCCILQLHYFHERFLHLCDVTRIRRDKQSVVGRLACPEGSLPDVSFASDGAHGMPGSSEQDMSGEKEDGEKDDYEEKEGSKEVKETDEETPEEDKWALVFSRLGELSLSLLEALDKAQALAWRLLELHVFKAVVFTCFWVALQEVSLLNCVFVVCWTIALPYTHFRPYASSISTVWTSVIIVAKMVYQLKVVQPNMLQCLKVINSTGNHSRLIIEPVDSATWWGLRQQSHDIPVNVFWYIKDHLLVLAVLLLEMMVTRRQTLCLSKLHEPPPAPGTLFQNTKRSSLDSGLLPCIKYFVNFTFYKFGLEVCFMLVVNVIGQRMDCMAVIHSLCLLVAVLCRRRRAIAALWPKYCRILAVLLLLQYFFCVGAPPTLCKEYPWGGGKLNSRLIKWLFLPDYLSPPNAMLLMNDFLLLLCAVLQQQVFKDEQQSEILARAGSNDEQALDPHRDQSLDARDHRYHNMGHREISIRPTSLFIPNFLYCRSYLDMIKVGVFAHLFWLSLIVIFITGTTRVSATCILYFVACFYFLLFGGHLLLKPLHQLLRLWDYLIAYTVLVITVRNILSVGACVYLKELGQRHCWFIQLFSLDCSVPGYNLEEENTECELPHNEPSIAWDAVCLMFLLLQRRVFLSSYFSYVVADLRASTLLALRGAELFQASIIKAVKARMEAEQKSVNLLKKQMRKIKMGQEKIRRTKSQGWTQHQEKTETSTQSTSIQSQDEGQEPDMHKRWWARWHGDHAHMIHSGDYFLFESDDENEEEEEEVQKEGPIKGAVQFAYQAWVRSSRVALEEQRRKEQLQKLEAAIKRVEKSQDEACRKAQRGDSALDSSDSESLDRSSESDTYRHGAVLRRGVNLLRFAWVLLAALGDGLSLWLASMSREYMDISAVLQNERHCLAKEIHKSHCLRSKSLLDRNLSRDEDGQYDDSVGGSDSSLPPDIGSLPCTHQRYRIRPPLHWGRNLDMDSLPDEAGSVCSNSECTQETLVPSRQSTFDTDSELEEHKDDSYHKKEDEEVQSLEQSEQASPRRRSHHQTSLDPDTSESEEGKEERKEEVEEFQARAVSNETTADELLKRMPVIRELEESAKFYGSQPRVLRLLFSMYATLAARSEMLCYFVIILNHINTATALTLVLPVLIFLWAMLSIPRPSKHFWMTAIVYTEVVVVIKFLNQFPFIIWNTTKVARILGVELKIEYANYDLAQLLVLFFHRSILKCNGLWDECKPISLLGAALNQRRRDQKKCSQRKKQRMRQRRMKEDILSTGHTCPSP
uniref:piezo-type mechanosensitive ion channel component 2-like n=1 Tax=Myxine glutinosa TaxID=7769 RepID=UPI00358E235D